MRAEGVSFRHAVELLQNDALPLAASASLNSTPPPKQSTVKEAADADRAGCAGCAAVDAGHRLLPSELLQSPEATKYLEKRGIASAEAVRTFKLGYANRTLAIGCRMRIEWRERRSAGGCSA